MAVESELEDQLKSSMSIRNKTGGAVHPPLLVRKVLHKPAAQWVSVAGEEVRGGSLIGKL